MNFLKLTFATIILSQTGFALAETIKVTVPDMECEHCSQAVSDKVKGEKGITKVEADIKGRVVTLTTDDSVKLTDDEVKALVKSSGFEATTVVRVGQ